VVFPHASLLQHQLFSNKTDEPMKLLVKNMVCDRCILVVQKEMKEIGFEPISVTLGEVDFGQKNLTLDETEQIQEMLEKFGFQLLDDRTSQLIQRTKTLLLELVRDHTVESEKLKLSDYLKDKLHYDYNYLSSIFSSVEGVTIEHYLIRLKIEKVKELLFYNELTLGEIAFQLGYSSVSHLSRQFKQVTGLTPSYFKNDKGSNTRRSLDKL
jgi:YesN/AraC family two-component response regulator